MNNGFLTIIGHKRVLGMSPNSSVHGNNRRDIAANNGPQLLGEKQDGMSESENINLATVGTAELEAMSVQVFSSCLDTMSGEAIVRFKRMRKLSASHRSALEKYIAEHPEKGPGQAGEAAPAAAKQAKGKPDKKAKAAKGAKPAKAKAAKSEKAKGPSIFAGLSRQMRAWWVGVAVKDLDAYDKSSGKPVDATPAPKAEAPKVKAPPPQESKEALPTLSRAEMLQMIWGEGYALPGGEEFTAKLLSGLELPAGTPCLDITAGLGGDAIAIASQHNIVVEAVEVDPELAEAAKSFSFMNGAGQLAPITCADPQSHSFNAKAYSAIYARETLFTVPDRKKLMANVVPSLMPLGNIILTDFMLTDRKSGVPEMKAWRDAEPVRPLPYTVEEYTELLDENRFSVRGCEDLSAEYIRFIQAGWKRLHTCLQTAKFSPETAAMLMNEGNVWLARCKALESGQLRLISIKGALRPVRSMSDPMTIT